MEFDILFPIFSVYVKGYGNIINMLFVGIYTGQMSSSSKRWSGSKKWKNILQKTNKSKIKSMSKWVLKTPIRKHKFNIFYTKLACISKILDFQFVMVFKDKIKRWRWHRVIKTITTDKYIKWKKYVLRLSNLFFLLFTCTILNK